MGIVLSLLRGGGLLLGTISDSEFHLKAKGTRRAYLWASEIQGLGLPGPYPSQVSLPGRLGPRPAVWALEGLG